MLRYAVLAALLSCRSYATDGDNLASDGLRARFFHNTTCAANRRGELRCFSSCSPVIYGMADDLATVTRTHIARGACSGAIDDDGDTTVLADGALVTTRGAVDAPALHGSHRAISGRGQLAVIGEHGLQVFAIATGALTWTDARARSVAMRPDGGIVVIDDALRAFAADGTPLWTQPIAPGTVAAGPHGEIATLAGGQLALRDATGQISWSRPFAGTGDIATDGIDLWVAMPGEVARESQTGEVWKKSLVGPAPVPRILALSPRALFLEVPVEPNHDPAADEDHPLTGVDDATMTTDSRGKLIVTISP